MATIIMDEKQALKEIPQKEVTDLKTLARSFGIDLGDLDLNELNDLSSDVKEIKTVVKKILEVLEIREITMERT